MSHNDATRLLSVIQSTIEKSTKSGAGIEVTYGQVFGLSGADASVYLAGSRELALSEGITAEPDEGFRVPAWAIVNASDYVRVSIDSRGHRWIDEVLPATPFPKVAIDTTTGRVAFGDGTAAPNFNISANPSGGLLVNDDLSISGSLLFGSGYFYDYADANISTAHYGGMRFEGGSGDYVQFTIDASMSRILFGSDIRIQRSTYAGKTVLDMADQNSAVGAAILVTGVGVLNPATAFVGIRHAGDTNIRVRLSNTDDGSNVRGAILFGDGINSADTSLYRSGASTLKTNGGFQVGTGTQTNIRGVVALPFAWTGTLPGTGTQDIPIIDSSILSPSQMRSPFPGRVVGVSVSLASARTAGTLEAQAYNGTSSALVGPVALVDATTTNNATANATFSGADDFGFSSFMRLRVTTNGFTPTANSIKGILYVALEAE